jgi:acetoin utilization deacetylase AcuC-like enzyme
MTRVPFDPIDESVLQMVHSQTHVSRIIDLGLDYADFFNPKKRGPGVKQTFGMSTYDNEHTGDCILLSAGSVLEATKSVCEGRTAHAFSNNRPPGHHAGVAKAEGFCFANNIAIAAKYAQERYNLQKIAIVDWDVHFGNGTYEIFS